MLYHCDARLYNLTFNRQPKKETKNHFPISPKPNTAKASTRTHHHPSK